MGSPPKGKRDESSVGLSKTKIAVVLTPSALFSAYFIVNREFIEAIISLGVGFFVLCMLKYMEKRSIKTRIDQALTTVIFHMYSLALGETTPSDLVGTIASNREYGFYSEVFKKIQNLSNHFGYGITNATAQIAKTVKSPLKDILIRCTNTFSSVEPKGYLEIESSMMVEEYAGYYNRTIKTLETLGGVFTSFQSITVFLIMTLVIMTVFMIDPSVVPLGYIVAIVSTVLMYFLFKSAAPTERNIYIGRYPPKLYKFMRLSALTIIPAMALFAFVIYVKFGASYAFIVMGVGVTVPGIFGYLLEKRVAQIDKNYPTFLKALGENLASTSDLKTSLAFLLHMELGPLRNLVNAALARVKLDINHRQALETLSEESSSYQVHMSNKILLDSMGRGADALVIGNALGNRVVKFLELRKSRDVVANSFQTVVLVTQPLIVVLLTVLEVLATFMSEYLAGISTGSYLGFNAMPVALIQMGNTIVIFVTAIVNALTVKAVSGGYWGTFFLNLGILLIISGVAGIASYSLIQGTLNAMPAIELPSASTAT
jgi:archaellum biogenesis protein FlaJ (TadC family)